MKWFRRIIYLILFIFTLFFGVIAIIGTNYKGEVIDFVKNELGKKLNREVRVEKIGYSLFSNFPNISVDLLNLETFSYKPGDTPFLELNKGHLVFDIIPLITTGKIKLSEIILEEGQINIIYSDKGIPNFNILKDAHDSKSSKNSFSIEVIKLKDIKLTYQDWRDAEIYEMSFEECSVAPGNFLDSIDASITFNGRLSNVKIDKFKFEKPLNLKGDLNIGLTDDYLRFKYSGVFGSGNSFFVGEIDFNEEKENWNIQCDLLNQNISNLLAILPAEFKDESLKSLKGDLNAKVKINGQRVNNKFPSLEVLFNFSNGLLEIDNEQLKGIVLNGIYSQPDITSILGAKANIDDYSIEYNGLMLKGKGAIEEFKNPLISVNVKSNFNIENIYRTFLKDEFKILSGDAVLDVDLNGKFLEAFTKKNKEIKKIKSKGKMNFSNVRVQPNDFDYPVSIESGHFSFYNHDLVFDSIKGKVLSSSFDLNGRIKDYLETILQDQPLTFNADLKIDKMILDEFVSSNSDSINSDQNVDYQFDLPESIYSNTIIQINEFYYRAFRAKEIEGLIWLKNKELSFPDFSMITCDGNASFNGYLNTHNPSGITFKCNSEFKNINAEKAFVQFENFGQDVLLKKHVKGRISMNTMLIAESDKQFNINENKLYSETQLNIDNGELIYFEPLVELQDFLKDELNLNFSLSHLKFQTLENNIKIKNGVITIPEMAIRSSDINLDISGKHTFAQDIDYLLKIKHSEIFKANKQNKIDAEFGVVENNDKTATLPLRMKGNIEDPKFSYDTKEKIKGIKIALKNEGKEIKKVFADEFGGIFKTKKNKGTSLNSENEESNNSSSKTQTIITWDEEEDEEEDED